VDEDFKKIYPVLIEKFLTAVPIDVPGTTFNALANKVLDVIIPWLEDKVLQHMKHPEKFTGDGTSAMIAANKMSDMPMSSVELAYELHHLFAAGMALNSPISNFLMTLEREPAVLEALRKESLATPYDPEIGITTDRVGNYPLLSAAYLESRRFTPNAKVGFARTRTAFNYTTLAGETYNIPQDWLTVLLLHSVHLDPANHDNPRTFKLERFQGQSDLEAVENFGVVAQGAGKPTGHLCAGWQLSGRLVRSLLVPLLREFRFSFNANDEMPSFKPESMVAYASEVTLKEFDSLSK
jgi:cytochrome P450